MITIKVLETNPFRENCWIVSDESGSCAIVDPGCMTDEEKQAVVDEITKSCLKPEAILLTHGHFDHIYGVSFMSGKYGIPVYMSPKEKDMLARMELLTGRFRMPAPETGFQTTDISESSRIRIGSMEFEVIETPGHTEGGVCFYDREDKILFSGDTLFAGAIGRTDSEWGDYDKLIVGIMDKVMGLDGDVQVLPGHGQSTDIGWERTHNPFLEPFNEKRETEETEEA